jgi:hypothetical protein
MRLFFLPLSLMLFACVALSQVAITTATLPNGTVKTGYSALVKASGGGTPYTWAVVSGKLPAGVTKTVSADTTSLDLSGTPTASGTCTFTVAVSGQYKAVSKKSYTVVIQSGANHVVDLSWKPSSSNDIIGYNVYRAPNGGTWEKMNASAMASTAYTDSTVANGSTYWYAATAVAADGTESAKTPALKAVIP